MTNKIRVAIIKANDNKIIVKDDFIPTVENMQKVVGGWLEAIFIREKGYRRITIWLNEHGKLNGLPPNFAIVRKGDGRLLDVVMGDVLISASDKDGDVVGLTDEELNFIRKSFHTNRVILSPVFCNKVLEINVNGV